MIQGGCLKTLAPITVGTTHPRNGPGTVTATDEHLFWLPELRTWTPADKLTPGELLQPQQAPASSSPLSRGGPPRADACEVTAVALPAAC
ncbi:hypothetical protein [Sinosporangium siamense]|uniref:Uncharacterized protein n=1 Tax=Sinosporangium siamense TaxID=1367973 RepID=A0A919VBV5_9ACTN|nr:hypothetical protein [Sinosporangium siamense]GII96947.1 hypothetical protein Ssi02_71780 [Sinosporangium siamense]